MSRTIVLEEPKSVELTLDGLGVVQVRAITGSRWLWRVRPTWQNDHATANAVLASCIRPRTTMANISRLSQRDRRRVMLTVVHLHDGEQIWRGLYGTHLSLDERFCAVMLWARRREASAIQAQLREMATANARVVPAFTRSELRVSSARLASSMVGARRLQKALASPLLGHSAFTRLYAPNALDLAGTFRVHGKAGLIDQLVTPRLDGLVSQVSKGLVGGSFMKTASAITARPFSGFDAIARSVEQFHAFEQIREFNAGVAAFVDAWEDDALWYLLGALGLRVSMQLSKLTRQDAEHLIFEGLEIVVRQGDVVSMLRQLVREAEHLEEAHRVWLEHGLEHAQRGEWLLALPNLHPGIEGALRATGIGKALLELPRSAKKVPPAETLIKQMGLDPEYTRFVVVRVFGREGNQFRHGHAHGDARAQVLLAVVACRAQRLRSSRLARRTSDIWSRRWRISEGGGGESSTSAAVTVSVTACSAMCATSGASTKRRPRLVSTTIPSKMCSRALSCTRRTRPTSAPSLPRTRVPRRSAR